MTIASATSEATAAPRRRWSRLRNLRLQLFARITMAFSLGALVLCLAVAAIAYFSARSTIAAQAIQAAEATALTNARTLQSVTPDSAGLNILAQLTGFDSADGSLSLYEFHSNWIVASPYTNPTPATSFSKYDLPASLVTLVRNGTAAEQVFG